MIMTKKLLNRKGSAYVEYFVAAAAFATAALWFYDGGDYRGVRAQYQGGVETQLDSLSGTVRIP